MLWILLVLIALVFVMFIPVYHVHDDYGYVDGKFQKIPDENQPRLSFETGDAKAGWFTFVAIAGAVAAFILGSVLSAYGPLHFKEHGVTQLVAVSDGSKGQGSYFLFSGYYDEQQTFSYYAKHDDGSFSRGFQYASNSVIFQDSAKPYLDEYAWVPNKWLGFTGMTHERNAFHVPAGSIKESVVLDNKDK